MPDPNRLAEALLGNSPACQWLMSQAGVFEQIFGDPEPLFGKPAKELTGRMLSDALDSERFVTWRGRLARVFEGQELALRERRGEGIWYISLFPVRFDGEITFAGGLARETTPWGSAEQDLRYTVLSALRSQEHQRAQLSKFLHDSVGQNLTALGLQLDLIRMDVETLPEICRRISEMQHVLEGMMEEVREYSTALNPSAVERAGLRSALDRLIIRLRARFLGTLRINVDPSLKLDRKIAAGMYHIAEEAVENAVQHSGCSAIEIAVKSTRAASYLEVKDNGRGFDSADVLAGRRGLGLLTMEHFAAEAGLVLSIKSGRDVGTTVKASTPEKG